RQLLRALRVVERRLDLAAMPDDARVLEQTLDVALCEACDPLEVEIVEGGAEILALGEDGAPAQARLEAFETQFLEQAAVVRDRKAPFGVVIVEELRCGGAPAAARLAVRTRCGRAHSSLPLGRPAAQPSRNFSRASACAGAISRISDVTSFSATNGSSSTRRSSAARARPCARMAPPRSGSR